MVQERISRIPLEPQVSTSPSQEPRYLSLDHPRTRTLGSVPQIISLALHRLPPYVIRNRDSHNPLLMPPHPCGSTFRVGPGRLSKCVNKKSTRVIVWAIVLLVACPFITLIVVPYGTPCITSSTNLRLRFIMVIRFIKLLTKSPEPSE